MEKTTCLILNGDLENEHPPPAPNEEVRKFNEKFLYWNPIFGYRIKNAYRVRLK